MTSDRLHSVRVKTGAGWRQFPRMRLLVSVGQEYHEGSKLQAVVDWINRNPHIEEVHVSVNDGLQRHNLIAGGLAAARAWNIALAEGAAWLARNEDALAGLAPARRATRWADWFKRPDFAAAHGAIHAFAAADPLFAEALATDAAALAARRTRRGEDVPPALIAHSHAYVAEELAVFALQSAALPAAEVYPGSNLASASYLIGKALPQAIRPLAARAFTRIDFARISPIRSALAAKPG